MANKKVSADTVRTGIGEITIQGDLLYKGASDLERLPKGTAAQVLTMNGGATAPSWATPAGGGAWNIIDTAVISSAVPTLTVTGLDTSVYETFVIRVTNFIPVTDGRSFRMRLGDSGGIDTGSTDYGYVYLSQQGGNHGPSVNGSNGADGIMIDNYSGNASGENFSVTATLSCAAASLKPHLHFTSSSVNANGNSMTHHGVGHRTAAINVTQVQVYFSSGNISSGRMTVWGIAHE